MPPGNYLLYGIILKLRGVHVHACLLVMYIFLITEQETLETRRKSIFQRINTYRSGATENTDQGNKNKPQVKKNLLNAPNRDNMQRRIAQWKKIEEEALRLEQERNRSRASSIDGGERNDVSSLVLYQSASWLGTAHVIAIRPEINSLGAYSYFS